MNDWLATERTLALGRMDAVAFVLSCQEEGIEPQSEVEEDLFQRGLVELKRAAMNMSDHVYEEETSRKNQTFGVTKVGLRKLDYDLLRDIFYGTHNLEIPRGIAQKLHPGELLAKWAGAERLKSRGHQDTIVDDFGEIIRALDGAVYKVRRGSGLNGCFRSNFSTNPGDQIGRLRETSETDRDRFVSSFIQSYKISDAVNPDNYDFHDPNSDGHNGELYVREIYRAVQAIR